jgi:hypothetical protein
MVSVLSDLYDLTVLDADIGIGISLVFSVRNDTVNIENTSFIPIPISVSKIVEVIKVTKHGNHTYLCVRNDITYTKVSMVSVLCDLSDLHYIRC